MPYEVKINGIKDLMDLGDEVKDAERKFLHRYSDDLAQSITKKSPKGHIPWTAVPNSTNTALVASSHPGAKALDKGAYMAPKGHPRLKFVVQGREVFPKFIRLAPRHYVRKGMRGTRAKAEQIWNQVIEELNG